MLFSLDDHADVDNYRFIALLSYTTAF
jgi:hypothetical protein